MADTTTTTAVAEKPQGDALAKRTETITTPTQFEAAMAKWTGHYNLLSPFTQITGLAPQHGIIASIVKINPDASKGGPGEVYNGLPFLSAGEVAIAKIGLRKIAEGAGISLESFRTDPRTIPYLWEFKAVATYRGIDGTQIRKEATAEWDLRDGAPRLKGWTANQVSEGRKNGLRNAETRAINAVIRELGIKQKYTAAELAKPFLVLRVAWQPDPTNPDQMRMVAEQALRGTSALYGSALPAPSSHQGGDVLDGDVVEEPRTVGSGTAAAEPKADAKPDPNVPPVEGAVRIERVDIKDGKNDKTGRAWKRFDIVDSNGEVASTFDATLAEVAKKFGQSKAWVELVIEQNGNYRNVIEIIPAGSEPKLPNLDQL